MDVFFDWRWGIIKKDIMIFGIKSAISVWNKIKEFDSETPFRKIFGKPK